MPICLWPESSLTCSYQALFLEGGHTLSLLVLCITVGMRLSLCICTCCCEHTVVSLWRTMPGIATVSTTCSILTYVSLKHRKWIFLLEKCSTTYLEQVDTQNWPVAFLLSVSRENSHLAWWAFSRKTDGSEKATGQFCVSLWIHILTWHVRIQLCRYESCLVQSLSPTASPSMTAFSITICLTLQLDAFFQNRVITLRGVGWTADIVH